MYDNQSVSASSNDYKISSIGLTLQSSSSFKTVQMDTIWSLLSVDNLNGYFHEINQNIPLWFYSMFFYYKKIYIHIKISKTHIEVAMWVFCYQWWVVLIAFATHAWMPISQDWFIPQLSVSIRVVSLREVLTILFQVYIYIYIHVEFHGLRWRHLWPKLN